MPTKSRISREWHFFDAEGKVLGSLASEIAQILIGKNKAVYTPNINVGDKVVVINAEKIQVTGTKEAQKIYYRHTGFPGGIKSETLKELRDRKPADIIKKAVYGMLPKNKLRAERLNNLYIYVGSNHPHTAQQNGKK